MSGEALGATGIDKRFGAVWANRGVSLSVARGTIHAVVGENGAGKSTLLAGLYGLDPPDAGEVRILGERVPRPSVDEAIRRGLGMVHQHFMLVGNLTVVENVVLGREPVRRGLLALRGAAEELAALGARYGLAVDPWRRVDELSVGEAQRVEIVKVLWRGAKVVILDEPTAVLSPAEVEGLFGVLRALRDAGGTVVLVAHKLDEVMAVAERVTVLRKGEVVGERAVAETTPDELARLIVGGELPADTRDARPPTAADAPVRLRAKGLVVRRADGAPGVDGVDLDVRAGEIVGLGGVQGNGQAELLLGLAGLLPVAAGQVLLDGADVTHRSAGARRALGLGHVPEDRHLRGLVLDLSLAENLLLGDEARYAGRLGLDRRRLAAAAAELAERFDVRPADPARPVRTLSGGNQQKLVVGRELGRAPRVLLCAHPTRGVDLGAQVRIHRALVEARAAGMAILLVSADLDELLLLSDRVAVLHRGRLAGLRDNDPARAAALRAELGRLMLGGEAAA